MKINRLSEIIKYLEDGMLLKDIAKDAGLSEPTLWRYVRRLKDAGYTVPTKRGRRKTLLL